MSKNRKTDLNCFVVFRFISRQLSIPAKNLSQFKIFGFYYKILISMLRMTVELSDPIRFAVSGVKVVVADEKHKLLLHFNLMY